MKYLILQHWTGEITPLVQLSSENMQKYAKLVGADYHMIIGNKFSPKYSGKQTPMQKLHMLNEEFDDYDVTCMVDSDMFTAKGMTRNIFTEETGVGIFTDAMKENAYTRNLNQFPQYSSRRHAFWGGGIYRLTLEMRQKFRQHINMNIFDQIANSITLDEACMHYLATMADVTQKDTTLPHQWCWCSFLPNLNDAYMIHIRNKRRINGQPERSYGRWSKLDTYYMLRDQGVFD